MMRPSTLAMTDTDQRALVRALSSNVETAFVGMVGAASSSDQSTFLLHGVVPVEESTYSTRLADQMVIGSEGFMPAIGAAGRAQQGFAFIHTHPRGLPRHSDLDDV